MAATMRSLKIKTSTCKRIVKELHSYEKEVERETAKTAGMKAKGADPYDLKQQVFLCYFLHTGENDSVGSVGVGEIARILCSLYLYLVTKKKVS